MDNDSGVTANSTTSGSSAAAPSPFAAQVKALRLPPPTRDSSKLTVLAWLLAIGLFLASAWLWRELERTRRELRVEQAAATGDAAKQAPVDPVMTDATAKAGKFALESKGYIIAAHQILVSPQVSGRLVLFNIEEGMKVAKGEVLAEIESTEYRSDYSRAEATLELAKQRLLELERGNRPEEVEQAKAEHAEAEATLRQLESEWKRSSRLVQNKFITDQDFEVVEGKYLAQQQRVERLYYGLKLMREGAREERIAIARAEVQQAEADLAKSKYRLDNCTIRAPVSGTILKKNAEQGNIVNPVALNGSFSICDMADLADLEVSLDIQERDIAQVFPGQACEIRADAFPKRTYRGTVSRLMPIADRAKGAVPVRVKLVVPAEDEGRFLKPEMGAVVSFLNSAPKP